MAPVHHVNHVGSFLRLKALLRARNVEKSRATCENDGAEIIDVAETDTIKLVLKQQLQHNVRPLTNGEYPRPTFYKGLFETLRGMTTFDDLPVPEAFRTNFPSSTSLLNQFGIKKRPCLIATGKIEFTGADAKYLKEWLQSRALLPDPKYLPECKFTIPAPSWQHMQLKPGTAYTKSSGYLDDDSYFRDVAACYTRLRQTLYEHGCRFIEIDDPYLTFFCDPKFLPGCEEDGTDADELLDLYMKVYSWIFEPFQSTATYCDLHVGLHLCRGNLPGCTQWASGSYEKIAQRLFNDIVGIRTFYLEFHNVEHTGSFEPLRFLPRGKCAVLGIVSIKKPELEDRDELIQRVKSAADVIAQAWVSTQEEALQEALAISPQCGFSSVATKAGVGMTWERQWEKLDLLSDIGKELWP